MITAIFSTLGSNTSLIPIAVKDGIETTGKVTMAYNEGAKESSKMGMLDAKEKLIDSVVTSVFWLGGIPILKKLFDKFATNKIYGFKNDEKYGKNALADIDLKLLDENSPQALKEANITDNALKEQVKKILDNKAKFKKIFAAKSAVSTLIPLAIVGWLLPKFIFAYTERSVRKQKEKEHKLVYQRQMSKKSEFAEKYSTFASFLGKKDKTTFKGMADGVTAVFTNPVYNMAILDGGISTGRITTARKKTEAIEIAIKEIGIIIFLYLGGPYIAKGFEYIAKKLLNKSISLDSKILENKKFTDEFKTAAKNKNMLNFAQDGEKNIIDFIDNELKNNSEEIIKDKKSKVYFKNLTLKIAQELGLIDITEGKRNPLKYIDTQALTKLNNNIKDVVADIAKNANPDKLINLTKNLKRASIVGNIGLCSLALAYLLPKAQYWYRNKYTNTSIAPGLADYYK